METQVYAKDYPHLDAVVEAYKDKVSFEKALGDYRAKSAFERLTTPRPKDPLPCVSFSDLQSVVGYAFRESYPELNSHYVGPEGQRVTMCTSLSFNDKGLELIASVEDPVTGSFQDELYRLQGPEGFRFAHCSYAENNHKVLGAELNSEDMAIGRRRHGLPFDTLYDVLQQAIASDVLTGMFVEREQKYSVSAKRDAVLRLINNLAADKSNRAVMLSKLVEFGRERNVSSLGDFVQNSLDLLSGRNQFATYGHIQDEFTVMKYDTLKRINGAVSPLRVFSLALDAQKSSRTTEKMDMNELMEISRLQANFVSGRLNDRKSRDGYMLDKFVANSLKEGYDMGSIRNFVDVYSRNNGISRDFRPAYDRIEQLVAGNYFSMVISETETAFGKGIKDSQGVDVQTPSGHFHMEMEQVREMERARVYLVSHSGEGLYTCDENGKVLFGSARDIASALYASGDSINLDALSKVSGQDLTSGYMMALAEDFGKRINLQGEPDTFSLPATILKNDIMWSVQERLRSGDLVTAGQMLSDAGVKFLPGETAEQSVYRAAARMYGSGTIEDIAACKSYRRRYESFILEARRFMKRSLPQQNQSGISQKMKSGGLKNF